MKDEVKILSFATYETEDFLTDNLFAQEGFIT